MGQVLHPI